jgi:hypothetical protein
MRSRLRFPSIRSINTRVSDVNLKTEFADSIQNLVANSEIGSLVKLGFYEDVTSELFGAALDSTLTVKSVFEFKVVTPSIKKIYIVHAVDENDKDRIYVSQSLSGTTFTNEILELTEHVGNVFAGAGSSATQIVVNNTDASWSKLSDTSGYYADGWCMVVDIAAGQKTGALIEGYTVTATTKTITVKANALTGIVATDEFSLARSFLLADGIGESVDSNNRYGGLTIDDIIRWQSRQNTAVGMTGSESDFPSQFQLWYGFSNNNYGDTDIGGQAFGGDNRYTLEYLQQLAPSVGQRSGTKDNVIGRENLLFSGSLPDATDYEIFGAYEFEDGSIGKLSTGKATATTSSPALAFDIWIKVPIAAGYHANNVTYDSFTINASNQYVHAYEEGGDYASVYSLGRRVTAVRLYIRNATTGSNTFFLARFVIAWPDNPPDDSGDTDYNCIYVATEGMCFGALSVSAESEFNTNNTYTQDVEQSPLMSNFKYGRYLDQHFLAANIINDNDARTPSQVIGSVIDGFGAPNFDSFGAGNIINLAYYGGSEVTGIIIVGDEGKDVSPKGTAIIFTRDSAFVISVTSGTSFSFKLDKPMYSEGVPSPDSVKYAMGMVFGYSADGLRTYDPGSSVVVSDHVKSLLEFTSTTDVVVGHDKKHRFLIVHSPTDMKTYMFDVTAGRRTNFDVVELNSAIAFSYLEEIADGRLLAVSGSKIYSINDGSDQDGTGATPLVKTIHCNASHFSPPGDPDSMFTLLEGYVYYQSDTAIEVNVYVDRSTTKLSMANLSFPANSKKTKVKFQFPVGNIAKEIQMEVTLSSANAATNTVYIVDDFGIDADIIQSPSQ